MTPPISRTAGLTWAQLEGRDFDAIDDLVAALGEVMEDGHWGHVHAITDLDIADFRARVIQAWRLAVMIEPTTF